MRIELTTFRLLCRMWLWDWRATYCAIKAHIGLLLTALIPLFSAEFIPHFNSISRFSFKSCFLCFFFFFNQIEIYVRSKYDRKFNCHVQRLRGLTDKASASYNAGSVAYVCKPGIAGSSPAGGFFFSPIIFLGYKKYLFFKVEV